MKHTLLIAVVVALLQLNDQDIANLAAYYASLK